MTNYARIINGVAVDVSSNPNKVFHHIVANEFQIVPDEVQHGWICKDGKWHDPEPAVES